MSRFLAGARTRAGIRTLAGNRVGDLGITTALYLNGTSTNNIDFGSQTFLDGTPFTFCLRVNSSYPSMAQDGTLWSYGFNTGSNKGYVIRADGSSGKLQFFSGTSGFVTNIVIVNKQYVFFDFDGISAGHAYSNTTLVATFTISPNTAMAATHTFLGCRDTSARFLTATVGDGAIYNRVLTASERTNVIDNAIYPLSGAQLIVKNNEGTGTTIVDYSGNGRNGTLGAGLWRKSPFNA